MAAVAGGVHGVLAWQFDYVAAKIFIGLCGALVMIMAGAISARRSLARAAGLGVLMGIAFFLARWTGWSLMEGGPSTTLDFLTQSPLNWYTWLDQRGISGFWILETMSMMTTALFGCYFGHERAEA